MCLSALPTGGGPSSYCTVNHHNTVHLESSIHKRAAVVKGGLPGALQSGMQVQDGPWSCTSPAGGQILISLRVSGDPTPPKSVEVLPPISVAVGSGS